MRGNHQLGCTEKEPVRDNDSKSASKRHPRPVEREGKDKSGRQRKLSEQELTLWSAERRNKSERQDRSSVTGTLTPSICWVQREARVRTAKESERARGTYQLSSTEAGTSQDSKRNPAGWARVTHVLLNADGGTYQHMKRSPASQEHSRTAERRGMDRSGQLKKEERGALTFY